MASIDKQLDAFCIAVARGSVIFAGPATAAAINDAFNDAGMRLKCVANDLVLEGTVYAVDATKPMEASRIDLKKISSFIRDRV